MPASVALALAAVVVATASNSVPTLEDLSGEWIDLTQRVSAHVNSTQLDMPIIANFHGSVGSSPAYARPVDLFSVNAIEIPPYAGCGTRPDQGMASGCGRLLVDGKQVPAAAVKYQADQMSRRSARLEKSGDIVVASRTRMAFENSAIMWEFDFTNDGNVDIFPRVTFEAAFLVAQFSHLHWVQTLPTIVAEFNFSALEAGRDGVCGVVSEGTASPTNVSRSAATALVLAGGDDDPDIQIPPDATGIPRAEFSSLRVAAGSTRTLRVVLTIGADRGDAIRLAQQVAGNFPTWWNEAHDKWQQRWDAAFDPTGSDFSGFAPTLKLNDGDGWNGSDVERVYYASILSIVSLLRTNLPLMHSKVWPTSQGNVETFTNPEDFGVVIGGAASWYWDEALSSMLMAFLEPSGRTATYQAWFLSDLAGLNRNFFALDCPPVGSAYDDCTYSGVAEPGTLENDGEKTTYPYNTWSYGFSIFNHLRVNNDSAFLGERAANSTMSVDEALERLTLLWQGLVVPNTRLVDYGATLDGFSPTYSHVVPGMQGNNVWLLHLMAWLRTAQGNMTGAEYFSNEAKAMATESVQTLFAESGDGKRGWFNVVWPESDGSLTAHEMRHIVDFFSMTFGLCGEPTAPCTLNATVRSQLSTWFHTELKTATWVRATSPLCNCSRSYPVGEGPPPLHPDSERYPGLVTCKADREDHGTTGAYTAWPALAGEALCYVEGDCASAIRFFASIASNTRQGAFGQANAVPQDSNPPYTPYNDEPSFKPADRRYLNMAVGAFADAIIRGIFSYHPPPVWPTEFSQEILDSTLMNRQSVRGFTGTLSNVRTPFGVADIHSGPSGLSISLQ